MPANHAGDAVQIVSPDGFQRRGNAAVQVAAARPAQAVIGHLPQLVVAEVIIRLALLADETPPPGFVQVADKLVLPQAGRLAQDVIGEGAADHRRRLDHPSRAGR